MKGLHNCAPVFSRLVSASARSASAGGVLCQRQERTCHTSKPGRELDFHPVDPSATSAPT
ncbi:hypothetical protein PUNSTDRAFT_55827 [Punctularia strigosozonata HHB-11173 SS5]|uniref:Uncharacterized protein n=1 Tax=Punctularia strigosozonata (strain HHB-11173) TaxID=741275 RepID=R7S0R3_PUNST|nr:uncharacterized protein PUNSTDRAFT_55827 [Punctularia strigosozonata HHB-11173 SS5]EIN03980.1 hypothetical protein PUNSTDRAFT_55827 [Punctularia strigosozonata HHB-11173 SS5]